MTSPAPTEQRIKSEIELAWAAGFFEGEGCVTYGGTSTGYAYAKATIGTTDPDVLLKFQRAVGMGKIYGPYEQKNKRHKVFWVWNLHGRDKVLQLQELLWPWLGQRRQEQFRTVLSRTEGKRIDKQAQEQAKAILETLNILKEI